MAESYTEVDMKWFLCNIPEDDLHKQEFHVDQDMNVIRLTDLVTGEKKYAGLFLMNSGIFKRSKYCTSIDPVKHFTWANAHVKYKPTRQRRLQELQFEIPILLT